MAALPVEPLRTELRRAGKRSGLRDERKRNVLWAKALERSGLEHGKLEKQIVFTRTAHREELCIQYPGKEAAREERTRPWDFRPKILLPDGQEGPDLSFGDIWEVLRSTIGGVVDDEPEVGHAMATLFYRIAFMMDHELAEPPEGDDVRWVPEAPEPLPSEHAEETFKTLYRYAPPAEPVRTLEERFPDWGGMSLEAFLSYNELLAWNEDCKYYHRARQKGDDWMGRTGRVNNVLTHVTIIGFLMEEVSMARLAGKFSSGAPGVAPATSDEIERITGGLVWKD